MYQVKNKRTLLRTPDNVTSRQQKGIIKGICYIWQVIHQWTLLRGYLVHMTNHPQMDIIKGIW